MPNQDDMIPNRRRQDDQWHLNKNVSISTIISIIVITIASYASLADTQKEVDLHWQASQSFFKSTREKLDDKQHNTDMIVMRLDAIRNDITAIKIAMAKQNALRDKSK